MIDTRATQGVSGRLIAVEGVDGSGKSTQIDLIHKWLVGLGCRVFFSEWNSSPLVMEATKKAKRRLLLTPTTFCLIHATDFADRYERQILPMLKAGYIVLCDRYVYTSYARDKARGAIRHGCARSTVSHNLPTSRSGITSPSRWRLIG